MRHRSTGPGSAGRNTVVCRGIRAPFWRGSRLFPTANMDHTVKGSEIHRRDETIAEICPGQLPRITPEKSKSEQKGQEDFALLGWKGGSGGGDRW